MIETVLDAPKLHHVGIIVADLDAAVQRYRELGFDAPELFEMVEQGVRVASFASGDGYIELMTPLSADSGVARYLATRGDGLHHVAYAVPDLASALRRLTAAGFTLIDAEPRRGIHDWRVAFIHPKSCAGVLTELVEER